MNMQCACWLWWAMSFCSSSLQVPHFSSAYTISLAVCSDNSLMSPPTWQYLKLPLIHPFSWLLPVCAPVVLTFSPLHCYSPVRPLMRSPGGALINPWPVSRAFNLSLCGLKCCLIFGFNKLVWSVLVATTFFWKSVGFWMSDKMTLHVHEIPGGWNKPWSQHCFP